METIKLVVQKRHQTGKGAGRRLRRAGMLPAVVYGHGAAVAIALHEKDLERIQQSEAGENAIVDCAIEGDTPENCRAILREVQIDPVSRAPLHADFYRVDMRQTLTVSVPLTFINEPHNLLRSANAILTYLWREVEVACLPQDIPDDITVDLADLQVGDTLKAGAMVLPPGVTLVLDPEEAIVTTQVQAEAADEAADEAEAAEQD